MLQTLFTIGSFQLRTINLFQVIAFVSSAFVFWRRGREEHYSEAKLIDAFLLSLLFGVAIGRIAFIVFNFSSFGWNILDWLNIVQKPGSQLFFVLIGAVLHLTVFAQKNKWDQFEILDFCAQVLVVGLLWINIGYFFEGIRFGLSTELPWGIVFPGVFEKRHPIQLYYAAFHFIFGKYLTWLEFNYRTFEWYRGGKKTAKTGFLFISFLLIYSLFSFLLSFLQTPSLVVADLQLDVWLYLTQFVIGVWLLLKRSNRALFSFKDLKFFALKK
ncbi:MAG: prolipoprotein diacylglyceryl transferase family protein [Patescibacteria group bacterium]|nr:prolipoprotein diacylglyceryl transferase family protein [Patescibacteria group bacterium]